MMTPAHTDLIERLRNLLADEPVLREVSMFGGRSFMVNEKMIVRALKDGGLLVRVPADRHDELLGQPGAAQAEMGTKRSMGPGWIDVSAEVTRDSYNLVYWVGIAMEYNRAIAKHDS